VDFANKAFELLDHIGWEILDAKRAREGWPGVARMGTDAQSGIQPEVMGRDGTEDYHIRQPQHVPLAEQHWEGLWVNTLARPLLFAV